ncbi:hypothetical protein H5410_022930 [Solanum commersonii]|uniref:Uncharacterized protein n=1 Tax=Solanum commersonii TaxID=4109 RepID=A0A9J5ZFF8_SOLCO|nr:hypothetical protein H5410_022930 [Solanum commersonii]
MEMSGFLQKLISKSQLLKDLKIQYCKGEVEIDSSNLESIEHMGFEIPKLKIARQLKKLKMDHYCLGSLKAAWFYNLRKFLSNSTSCPQVSLWFSQCNEINLTDLHYGVATPKVDVLNVSCRWTNGECATFLDALLWSCHPRRLNIQSTSATFKCFINRLIYLKNLSQYSPWHSQFKEAQVYMFDFDDDKSQSWRPVQLKIGELSTRIVSEKNSGPPMAPQTGMPHLFTVIVNATCFTPTIPNVNKMKFYHSKRTVPKVESGSGAQFGSA